MYKNETMRPIESAVRMGGGRTVEDVGGMNLTNIYYKHVVNVTMYPSTTVTC
jgi:hypothetical protein